MATVFGPTPPDQPTVLRAGSEAGLARARQARLLDRGLEASARQSVTDALNVAERLLDGSESPRFAALFGELVTVAAVSRLAYKEERLSQDAIARFLDASKLFLNSWVHRDKEEFMSFEQMKKPYGRFLSGEQIIKLPGSYPSR